jgi:hypothetical protein
MRTIREQDAEQLRRRGRAIDRSAESDSGDRGQVARVIEVRMRENHGVEGLRVERRRLPIALAQAF